jgi:hypothetical protein
MNTRNRRKLNKIIRIVWAIIGALILLYSSILYISLFSASEPIVNLALFVIGLYALMAYLVITIIAISIISVIKLMKRQTR